MEEVSGLLGKLSQPASLGSIEKLEIVPSKCLNSWPSKALSTTL